MTGSNSVSSNWMGQIRGEGAVFAAIGGAGTGRASSGDEPNTRNRLACGAATLLPGNDFRDNEARLFEFKTDG